MSNRGAPLLEELLKYHNENNLILSMPGNKAGAAFERDALGKEFVSRLGHLDITEVEPLDNLHKPQGVIKEAEIKLRDYYNCKRAFFLVNGSTSGNMAAIFSAFQEGDEIIVERNCHKSIYNAILLKKLKVVYIEGKYDEENEIILSPTVEEIQKAFKKAKKPKGIILTYPNYFGISYNLECVIQKCKKENIKVIIDGAHGAHFKCCQELPKSLSSLADYIILSAHKTLPALTGGAYLLLNCDDKNIDFYVSTFTTTSPSYLIMASLDYGRYYMCKYGKEDYKRLIDLCNKWRRKINALKKVYIIGRENLKEGYEIDETRYTMVLPKGYSGEELLNYLRKEKIQGEMSFNRAVVLIFSPYNEEEDFEKLYIYKKNNKNKKFKFNDEKVEFFNIIPRKLLEPFQLKEMKGKKLKICDCEGKIAADFVIPYPPGIPILCPGEEITLEIINIIEQYIERNCTIIGVDNNYIKVISL